MAAYFLHRAKGYLTKCNEANDDYYLKWFVQPGTHLIRSPTNQPAWSAINNNVDAINRQMMFNGWRSAVKSSVTLLIEWASTTLSLMPR